MSNKKFSIVIGLLFFALYVFLLWFRPMESWCDDAYWTDWSRQLGLHNRYYTTVWGFGKPSYCPLYALLLGGWFKIVGFSFFKAQLPNMVITLLNFLLITYGALKENLLKSKVSILFFSVLFWLAPVTFWVYNCGRIENLCLLLGLCTFYSLVCVTREFSWKSAIFLVVSSALLFATGVEGVVFATLFCLIYSCVYWRESITQWKSKLILPYSLHFGGYIGGLAGCCVLTYKTGCLHAFFDTMFGFSKTFTNTYRTIRALVKNTKHGEIVDTFQTPVENHSSYWENLVAGLSNNVEYCVLAGVVLLAMVWMLANRKKYTLSKMSWVVIAMGLLAPFVYVLAGRYTSYYTWAAFVPLSIALVCLLEHIDKFRIGTIVVSMFVLWGFSTSSKTFASVDFSRSTDEKNQQDITNASDYIRPGVPCVIPYQWYYYVVDWDEDIYFQASGAYPDNLKYVIYSPTDYNEEKFMNSRNLQEVDRIEDKIVYEVVE